MTKAYLGFGSTMTMCMWMNQGAPKNSRGPDVPLFQPGYPRLSVGRHRITREEFGSRVPVNGHWVWETGLILIPRGFPTHLVSVHDQSRDNMTARLGSPGEQFVLLGGWHLAPSVDASSRSATM